MLHMDENVEAGFSGGTYLDLSPAECRSWRALLPDDMRLALPDDAEDVPDKIQSIFDGTFSAEAIPAEVAKSGYSFKRTQAFRVVCWLAEKNVFIPRDGDHALVGIVNHITKTAIAARIGNGLVMRFATVRSAMVQGEHHQLETGLSSGPAEPSIVTTIRRTRGYGR